MIGARQTSPSVADLTRAVFGEVLSMDALVARLGLAEGEEDCPAPSQQPRVWVGSVGYEKFRDNRALAAHLVAQGVRRLVDVRELPMSRRRGYGKTALAEAMAGSGIEYVHMKGLGNPKPYRDMYKSGDVEQGRKRYTSHLLGKARGALDQLVPLLRDKRTVLMCVEHDVAICHRAVIFDALRTELGLDLDVVELG